MGQLLSIGPSGRTREASSGSSAASAASAPRAWPIAFISCQWPSSMIVTSAASSHQKSSPNSPRLVASEATYATVIAIAISSIMPGARSRISLRAPVRKGHPPYRKTAVPRIGPVHAMPGNSSE